MVCGGREDAGRGLMDGERVDTALVTVELYLR